MPDGDKIGLLTDWSERLLAADGVDHVEAAVQQVLEKQVLRRPRRHEHHPAASPAAPRGDRDQRRPVPRHVRVDADLRAAGRPRLGIRHRRAPGTGPASWPPSRSGWPRRRRRHRSARGNTTWSSTRPTSGSPSTSRSGTRPSWTAPSATRRRTQGRRSRPSTSSARCATAPTLMNVTGDRTAPHELAAIPDTTTTACRPGQGHREVRRPGGIPAGPPDGPAQGPRPVQRMRLRRLARPHPGAAHGQRVDPAGGGRPVAGRPDRRLGGHLRGRRPVVVDRHAAILQFGQRCCKIGGGRLAGQLRDVAYQAYHDRLLGLDGGGRRAGHLRAARRVQLRQGPARAGRRGQPRLPAGALPRRQHPQHGRGAGR